MKYALRYSRKAMKDLAGLDAATRRRILEKLDWFLESGSPMQFATPLKGPHGGFWRFRVGDHRVLFFQDARGKMVVLEVVSVLHRREAYE